MGYTTDFKGKFNLNKKLDDETFTFLMRFANSRRMARNVDKIYGVEGEFYVKDDELGIIDYNRPPKTQPGLWCQWVPSEDGMSIEWNGGEKFYDYVDWIKYIIKKFLKPKGYILNGEVEYQGEDIDDRGVISIKNNIVTVKDKIKYE